MQMTAEGPTRGLWGALRRIRALRFTARSGAGSGWNGTGSGTVLVTAPQDGVLLFEESGTWQPDQGKPLRFRNVFRWTLLDPQRIRLEHLRFGPAHPVYLFDLAPTPDGSWCSLTPHLCAEDCYSARLDEWEQGFHLAWSIRGPRKEEPIEYDYSTKYP